MHNKNVNQQKTNIGRNLNGVVVRIFQRGFCSLRRFPLNNYDIIPEITEFMVKCLTNRTERVSFLQREVFTCTCRRNPRIPYTLIAGAQRNSLAREHLLVNSKSISYLASAQKCVVQLVLNCIQLLEGKSQY